MSYGDTLARVDFALQRESAFSYQCNACSRCCHNKAIRVGPYEILRLARRLGMTTTEFIAQHTEAGGTVLRMRDENNRACILLNQQGCSVHPDRPLACRLYPLARYAMTCSMSRKGNCRDNAPTESFFNNLKNERVHGQRYRTRDEAKADVFAYIEAFYNRTRRHSTLGFRSPVEFMQTWIADRDQTKQAA